MPCRLCKSELTVKRTVALFSPTGVSTPETDQSGRLGADDSGIQASDVPESPVCEQVSRPCHSSTSADTEPCSQVKTVTV